MVFFYDHLCIVYIVHVILGPPESLIFYHRHSLTEVLLQHKHSGFIPTLLTLC